MITAETLAQCAYLSTPNLELLLRKSYPEDRILTSRFLGVTNGGQFCYSVLYPGEEGNESTKVFVWQENNELRADY